MSKTAAWWEQWTTGERYQENGQTEDQEIYEIWIPSNYGNYKYRKKEKML